MLAVLAEERTCSLPVLHMVKFVGHVSGLTGFTLKKAHRIGVGSEPSKVTFTNHINHTPNVSIIVTVIRLNVRVVFT